LRRISINIFRISKGTGNFIGASKNVYIPVFKKESKKLLITICAYRKYLLIKLFKPSQKYRHVKL
jgi:hypothetical protein